MRMSIRIEMRMRIWMGMDEDEAGQSNGMVGEWKIIYENYI